MELESHLHDLGVSRALLSTLQKPEGMINGPFESNRNGSSNQRADHFFPSGAAHTHVWLVTVSQLDLWFMMDGFTNAQATLSFFFAWHPPVDLNPQNVPPEVLVHPSPGGKKRTQMNIEVNHSQSGWRMLKETTQNAMLSLIKLCSCKVHIE